MEDSHISRRTVPSLPTARRKHHIGSITGLAQRQCLANCRIRGKRSGKRPAFDYGVVGRGRRVQDCRDQERGVWGGGRFWIIEAGWSSVLRQKPVLVVEILAVREGEGAEEDLEPQKDCWSEKPHYCRTRGRRGKNVNLDLETRNPHLERR